MKIAVCQMKVCDDKDKNISHALDMIDEAANNGAQIIEKYFTLSKEVKMKIAVCQMKVCDDKDKNISHALDMIDEAANNGAQIIVLPEMFNCPYENSYFPVFAEEYPGKTTEALKNAAKKNSIANNGAQIIVLPEMFNCPYENSYFPVFAEEYPGKTTEALKNAAKKNSIYLVGGSIPESENGNIYNTSFIFDRNGELIGKHQKMHLFDMNQKMEISTILHSYLTEMESLLENIKKCIFLI